MRLAEVHRDDAWNWRHRSEGPMQRADRNFAELLQEIRVLLTGVQILLGFLLAVALSPAFASIDGFRLVVYVMALISAAASSALLVTPIVAHRLLFRRGQKCAVVATGHRMTLLALIGLGFTICSGMFLVLDLTVGRVLALVLAAVMLVGIGTLWIGMPMQMRRRCAEVADRPSPSPAPGDRWPSEVR